MNERFTSVLETRNLKEFRAEVLRFSKWLGFDLMGAFVAFDEGPAGSAFFTIDNTPEGFRSAFEDTELCRLDPVMQHCRRSSTPVLWDRRTYLNAGMVAKWELQASFGYAVGAAIALHLPAGVHFFLGVDRDRPLAVGERDHVAANLCLFSAYAQEGALRALAPGRQMVPAASLSARELEVLRWTAEGKTAWEVGRILGISEQTVARHVNSAAQKLGCVNKVQAVAKALRLGLLG